MARNSFIMPAVTAVSTAETVIMEDSLQIPVVGVGKGLEWIGIR